VDVNDVQAARQLSADDKAAADRALHSSEQTASAKTSQDEPDDVEANGALHPSDQGAKASFLA